MTCFLGAEHAFAAIRSDGRVVTWGHGDFAPEECLDSQLQDVQPVPVSSFGVGAIGSDGSVIKWTHK